MWNDQMHTLSATYKVVTFDMRGYGRTVPAPGPFSHTGDLGELMDELGMSRASLVGCSLGGIVALDFALSFPDRVESLVMVGSRPAGYPVDEDTRANIRQAEVVAESGDLDAVNRLEIENWVTGLGRSAADVPPAVYELALDMNRIALQFEEDGLIDAEPELHPNALEKMSRLRVPVLIVIGEHDRGWVGQAARDMASRVDGARIVTIPRAAHLPSMEQPRLFDQEVLAFLDQLQRP
jgi:pimeloyl-ACP methyl ester carboxylesterase